MKEFDKEDEYINKQYVYISMSVFLGLLPLRHGVLRKQSETDELNVNHEIRLTKFFRMIKVLIT